MENKKEIEEKKKFLEQLEQAGYYDEVDEIRSRNPELRLDPGKDGE